MQNLLLEEWPLSCPYCGESISVLIDGSAGSHQQVEDCQVCCQPMLIVVDVDTEGRTTVQAHAEH